MLHCLFSCAICFSKFSFLVFSFLVLSLVFCPLFSLWLVFFLIFFALMILFSVIFLLTPLSARSGDFLSYSLVVTCNYVITSTSILFKALSHSKVVNNWRRSVAETFLLNFFIFFTSEVVYPRIFLNSLRSCLLWDLDCESLLVLQARCTFVGLSVVVTIYWYI